MRLEAPHGGRVGRRAAGAGRLLSCPDMQPLEELEGRYDALRDRDRTIASLQSKQRMISTFEHVLDGEARARVDARLRQALDLVRAQARTLAL